MQRKPGGLITDEDHPSCGRLFKAIQKPGLRRLLLKMMHPDPLLRLSVEEALHSSWMKTVECCCPVGYEDQQLSGSDSTGSIGGTENGGYNNNIFVGRVVRKHNHSPPRKGMFSH